MAEKSEINQFDRFFSLAYFSLFKIHEMKDTY